MLGWAVETTLVAAGLAALTVLAGRSRRLTPEARHTLWLVVLLRFLVPPLVAWPWARGDRPGVPEVAAIVVPQAAPAPVPPRPAPAKSVPAETVAVEPPTLPGPLLPPVPPVEPGPEPAPSTVVAPGLAALAARAGAASDPPALAPVAPVVGPSPASIRLNWRPALLAGWLAGAVAMAARGGIRAARFRRTLRLAEAAPGWLAAEVTTVAARLGVRRPPPSQVVPGLPTPLLWCLGRARLVLPTGLERRTAAARSTLLAHELAHLARRDHWVARLEILAGMIWWWNPVYRLAARRLRDAAEAACDARVVRAFPKHRFAYAEALVEVCASHARPVPPLPALGIGGPRAARTLGARLGMILRDPARPPSRWLPALALMLLGLAAPAWTLGQQHPDPSPAAPTGTPADPGDAPPVAADAKQVAQLRAEIERLKGRLDAASKPAKRRRADPAREGPIVLKARRDAQAAEVERVEANRDQAALAAKSTDKLLQSKAVNQLESDLFHVKLRAAEAEVARERAKLAEADAMIGQARPGPILTAEQVPMMTERSTSPADYHDQVDLAQLQVRGRQGEVEYARTKLSRATERRDEARKIAAPNAVGAAEIRQAEESVEVAQADLAGKENELLVGEARLKQARRRADAVVARVKQLRTDWEQARRLFQVGEKTQQDFDRARARHDDLMFQFDPNYRPEAEGIPQTAAGDQRRRKVNILELKLADLKLALVVAEAALVEATGQLERKEIDFERFMTIQGKLNQLRIRVDRESQRFLDLTGGAVQSDLPAAPPQ